MGSRNRQNSPYRKPHRVRFFLFFPFLERETGIPFQDLRISGSLPGSVGRRPHKAYPEPSDTDSGLQWRRNINLLPFHQARLTLGLGPAYPRLIIMAGEPLLFRWSGISPDFAATNNRIFNSMRSTGPHSPASAPTEYLPTIVKSGVSVVDLLPSIFSAFNLDG